VSSRYHCILTHSFSQETNRPSTKVVAHQMRALPSQVSKTQPSLTKWLEHKPFIPGVHTNCTATSNL
jgi:hypothetical protein